MAKSTYDRQLIVLIEATLDSVDEIETNPLLYAPPGRRRSQLLSSWLDTVEERLDVIEVDHKMLIYWLEHPAVPAPRSATAPTHGAFSVNGK